MAQTCGMDTVVTWCGTCTLCRSIYQEPLAIVHFRQVSSLPGGSLGWHPSCHSVAHGLPPFHSPPISESAAPCHWVLSLHPAARHASPAGLSPLGFSGESQSPVPVSLKLRETQVKIAKWFLWTPLTWLKMGRWFKTQLQNFWHCSNLEVEFMCLPLNWGRLVTFGQWDTVETKPCDKGPWSFFTSC